MTQPIGITVAMICRDERDNLEALLPAVLEGADDVVIVDTGSTDGTADTAKRLGARVFEDPWQDDFSRARNRGLEEIRTSHVLWLDADDRLGKDGLDRIRSEIAENPDTGLALRLVNENPDPSAVTSCWQLRAFPAHPEHRFEGRVHEQMEPSLRRRGISMRILDVVVSHRGYVDRSEVLRKARRNVELLRRELAEREDDLSVMFHFVMAAKEAGELDDAAQVARRALDREPDRCPAPLHQTLSVLLSQIEWTHGRAEESEAVLRRSVERAPELPIAHFFLGDLLRRRGDLAGALRELRAARLGPLEETNLPLPIAGLRRAIRMQLGELLEALQSPAEASTAYSEILERNEDDPLALAGRARTLVALGRYAEAEGPLTRMAERGREDEARFLRATVAFLTGDDAEAERRFHEVEVADASGWAAPLHLGHLALRQGHKQDALAHYSKALSRADRPETRVGMAACQLELGRVAECLDHLARAAERAGSLPLPAGTEALSGEALFLLGRPQEAREAFERHLTRFGPEPRILSRLADVYRSLGAAEAARLGYEEALRLSPGLTEARLGLETLETAP